MTDDDELAALAEAAGVMVQWRDVHGRDHVVTPDTLRAVLDALRLPAASTAQIRETAATLRKADTALPAMVTVDAGARSERSLAGRVRVTCEDGSVHEADGRIPVISQPGYHSLETSSAAHALAVAPRRCHPLPAGRPWGIAVQLYALRREGDGGLGDFAALGAFARAAAVRGADAVAISPVHALFSADPARFSPYSPSSRIMLNVLHAAARDGDTKLEAGNLVQWPEAARARLASLRRQFETDPQTPELAAFRAARGEALEAHARFEALHARLFGRDARAWHWRDWDPVYRDPASPEVAAFAQANASEVAFHAWLQMRAERDLQAAHETARLAGMRIGLINDLAVGTDGGGSHAWSRQDETLIGLTVGAPPDVLNVQGQDWGVTAFSPRGLVRHGYTAFLEMLRAALRHAGGVRIDHVMGLQRLWVIPEGARADAGAYLRFPLDDLMRLVALESHRHGAIVLGEDLGTVPEGFQPKLVDLGVLGMRVLWFERDGAPFRAPARWSPAAASMTSTHDLPTVAGWWRGLDIDWRVKLALPHDETTQRQERERDRDLIWQAFQDSGAASGDPPPPDEPAAVVDAAVAHVAGAACGLALLPLEDVLGVDEQPNFPGTIHEHPNWRRRMPGPAQELLDPAAVEARLATVRRVRT